MTNVILANGKVLPVTSFTLEPHFICEVDDWDGFIDLIDQLTPANLSQIQAVKDDQVVATYEACDLVGTQTINDLSPKIIVHIYMTGSPVAVNEDYKQAYQILAGGLQ